MRSALLPVALAALLLGGCSPRKSAQTPRPLDDDRAACCSECVDAASKDPQARDLETLACRSYSGAVVNGAPALTDRCVAWFEANPTMVGACRGAR